MLENEIKTKIKSALSHYLSVADAEALVVIDFKQHDLDLEIHLNFKFPARSLEPELLTHFQAVFSEYRISLNCQFNIRTHATPTGSPPLPGVKNIIAVASGKGGVGKSTTAVNLALALHHEGARVGILDADIYGPSQPMMLGVTDKPESRDQKLIPIECYGVQSMSIGYLVEDQAAIVWRGPMVSRALMQLLNDTAWHDLDYLIIDLPPGTGDIQLTLAQKIPVSGAVIVTTPQELALLDVRRAIEMFQKVQVPVLGIVENMSTHTCTQCGHTEAIFGEEGGEKIAAEYQVELLAQLPLSRPIREQADAGKPIVVSAPTSDIGKKYLELAQRTSMALARQSVSFAHKFPKIVVE